MKKLRIGVVFVLVLLITVLVAVIFFINPNQFKPLIVEQTKKATGLDLVIDGDIHWQLFPALGFGIGQTAMRNPEGFEETNLFQVNAIDVSIELIPLFKKQLMVGQVVLKGADIQIETLSDGRTNLDSFTASNSVSGVTSDPSNDGNENSTSISVSRADDSLEVEDTWHISVAGVSIKDSNLVLNDRKTGVQSLLQVADISVTEFSPGEWSQITFDVAGKSNDKTFITNGSAKFTLSPDFQEYALRSIEVNGSFDDGSNTISKVDVVLDQFQFGEPTQLQIDVEGVVSDLALSLVGQSSLVIDKALTSITASQLDLSMQLESETLPQSPLNIVLDSNVVFDLNNSELKAIIDELSANDIELQGATVATFSDVTQIRFELHGSDIDIDQFLDIEETKPSQSSSDSDDKPTVSTSNSGTVEVEPDLSALKHLDVAGIVTIDELKTNNVELTETKTKFSIKRGLVKLEAFEANLYQGSISAKGQLDGRKSPATYQINNTLTGVQIEPLLQAVAETDIVEGTGNLVTTINGKGLTSTQMKKNLAGTVEIKFTDGAVKGFNIAQQIRNVNAKLNGESDGFDISAKETDFSALTATLKLANGELSTNNLAMQSPLLRIHGKGSTNYINEKIKFWLDTAVVGSLEGQGGASVDDLKDITIPVEIKGSWSKPDLDIPLDEILKQRARKKITKEKTKLDEKIDEEVDRLQEKINSKIKDEQTKDTMNKLLKKIL
ncbi:AsmA family protein [Vibrio sp. WJH972]